MVHTNAPEKRNARRKVVHVETRLHSGAQVLQTVRQRVSEFDIRGGSGFLHMVSAHTDAVELRHFLRAVAENVADDPHGTIGRINIGIADHEFFQDVVLNGAAQLLRFHSLLFGGHNVKRHDWEHGAVHGHRHRHLAKRNLVEQNLHIEDRVDCHASLADIAGHALVVGVVSSMRGQIERNR